MKISCQSCHSKYNVADEKIQGKIVKIRCRKCGATIVVNASAGAPANGSAAAVHAPAAAGSAGPAASPAAGADEWHVSISDDDQRTMTLADLITAYNTGVVTAETFVWTDGMQDWKALAEVDAVVSALHSAAGKTAPAGGGGYGMAAPAQPARSPAHEASAPRQAFERPAAAHGGGVAVAQAAPAAAQEQKRAAVVKRDARARDLFATRTGEELNAAVAGLNDEDARLTGQRNENSVLFSLQHLTKSSEEQRSSKGPSIAEADDSGVIDLKALAAKAESMRPMAMPDQNHLAPPLGFVSPLASHLGSPGPGSDAQTRSKLPLLIGGGAGVALLLVLGIVIGLKMGGAVAPDPGTAANAPTFVLPSATPSATAEPTATASASAAAASASSAAPAVTKPHGFGGAGGVHPGGAPKPGGGGVAAAGGAAAGAGTAGGAAAGAGGGSTPAPPAPKKNDCGCNGDLMCMMKCSTH